MAGLLNTDTGSVRIRFAEWRTSLPTVWHVLSSYDCCIGVKNFRIKAKSNIQTSNATDANGYEPVTFD